MTRYYRSKTGKVVHYWDCTRRTDNAKPWLWADGKSDALIAMFMAEHEISPCRLCRPPLWPTRAHLRLVANDE